MIDTQKIKERLKAIEQDSRFKKAKSIFRRLLVAAILGMILYQLFRIGWMEVLRSLPTQPLFYILFLALYISLPAAEILIYKQVWRIQPWKAYKAFLIKKVYNVEVMGYSGEFYLFLWARKHVGNRDSELLRNIRDNNLISAFTSNLIAFTLIGVLLYTQQIDLSEYYEGVSILYVVPAVIIAILLVMLLINFRSYLFNLSLRKTLIVFSIYFARFIAHHGLLIVIWSVAIPETPISVWFTYVTVVIVINRIPFLPSKDLIFIWAGIELSKVLDMATASVAGMLLVFSAMSKILNLLLYLIFSMSDDPDLKKVITGEEPHPDPESGTSDKIIAE